MKVKELIKELEKYDGELEVKVNNIYREELMSLTIVREQYKTLDERYIYIG